jgi:hypothetical protein
MSFKGFLESEHSPTIMSGQFDSTFGANVSFTLGSTYDHTFGTESRMFVDPFAMIPGKSMLSLLFGPNGKVDYTIGSSTTIAYVGPEYEIKRLSKRKKISEANFSTAELSAETMANSTARIGWKAWGVDVPVATAVAVLSLLMGLIALALDLTLHFRYPAFGSEDDADQETIDGYGESPKIIKAVSTILVSRMMMLVRLLEVRAKYVTGAVQAADDSTGGVVQAAGSLAGQQPVAPVTGENLDAAATDAQTSLTEAGQAATSA